MALVTPFMENGAIDFAAVAKIVDKLIAGGVDYILVLGTTGETPTLSTDERKALIRFGCFWTARRSPSYQPKRELWSSPKRRKH